MSGGQQQQQQQQNESQNQRTPQNRRSLFGFRHLIAVATAAVLAASGMVSADDMAFVIFSIIYIYFLSNVAFPTLSPSMESRVFGQKNRAMGLYILFTALIGLFLPIAYIVLGIYEGDREGIKASAPHVFLLTIQVFMEGVFYSDRFSLPIWVFVPVFYNSRRIFTLVEWVRAEYSQSQIGEEGGNYNNYNHWRCFVGRGLAITNLALWCFNLFGFLLPVFLPRAFKIYYSSGHNKVN